MEVTELKAETSGEEVKEAIKKPKQEIPGHGGTTYELSKSWKEPRKTVKKMMLRNL